MPGLRQERKVIVMGQSVSQMVAEAKARVENLSPDQVASELKSGTATLIDIREESELASTGQIAGAHHAPRGMLEFYADPTSPYHREEFDPENRIILTCASGGRSALAADTLRQMGFRNVAHLDGGIRGWIEQGLPVEHDQ
jgi:rhodanese-related sulfurtransferase